MTDQTLSELLVLFLSGFACSRIFFQRQVRSDSISVVPAVALVIALLNFFAWGVNLTEILVFLLAFFVFLWNIRALLRLNAQLVIDHYGPWFTGISLLNLLLSIAAIVIVFINRPVTVSTKKAQIIETQTSYSGSFREGFTKVDRPFIKASARLYTYTPQQATANSSDDAILFIANKCATVAQYRPFLVKLAHDGHTVYAADFYSKDNSWFKNCFDGPLFRRFTFCWTRIRKPDEYKTIVAGKDYQIALEYRALNEMVCPSESGVIFLVGDELTSKPLHLAQQLIPHIADDTFNLATVEGYTTPTYGPLEQTDPLFAKTFGFGRDVSQYMSAHLALALEKEIARYKLQLPASSAIDATVAPAPVQPSLIQRPSSAPQPVTNAPPTTTFTPQTTESPTTPTAAPATTLQTTVTPQPAAVPTATETVPTAPVTTSPESTVTTEPAETPAAPVASPETATTTETTSPEQPVPAESQ